MTTASDDPGFDNYNYSSDWIIIWIKNPGFLNIMSYAVICGLVAQLGWKLLQRRKAIVDAILVYQLMLTTTQTRMDLSQYNQWVQISPEWLQRRRNIITQLETVANNLSQLHDTTTMIDKIGTSVAVAGNGLKIGALFTGLINGQDPSQEALNAGNWLRLIGIGTSATAQLYEKTESYERIRQLRTDLQRDQRDFEALQNLLDTIDDVVRRLNLAAPLLAKLRHLSPTDWLMLYNNVSTIYLRSGGDASDCKEEWNALGQLLRDDTLTVFLRENVESLGRIKLSSLNSEPLRITWNMIDQSASAIRELVDNNRRDTAAALVNDGMAFVLNINHLRNLLTANETEPQHILSLRNYARQMQNELDRAS